MQACMFGASCCCNTGYNYNAATASCEQCDEAPVFETTPTPAPAAVGQCCRRNDPAGNDCGQSGGACARSSNEDDCQKLPGWYGCEWRSSPTVPTPSVLPADGQCCGRNDPAGTDCGKSS